MNRFLQLGDIAKLSTSEKQMLLLKYGMRKREAVSLLTSDMVSNKTEFLHITFTLFSDNNYTEWQYLTS